MTNKNDKPQYDHALLQNLKFYSKKILAISIILLFLILFVTWKINFNELINNHSTCIGIIKGIKRGKNLTYFQYSYSVNNVLYTGESSHWISSSDARNFIGKFFPVIYSKDNPTNAELLVTKNDFSRFKENFPDSLRWVMHYFPLE